MNNRIEAGPGGVDGSWLMWPAEWDMPPDMRFGSAASEIWLRDLGLWPEGGLRAELWPELGGITGERVAARIVELCATATLDTAQALATAYRVEPRTRNIIMRSLPADAGADRYYPVFLAMLAQGEAPIATAFAISMLAAIPVFAPDVQAALRLHWDTPWFREHATKALVDTIGAERAASMLADVGIDADERARVLDVVAHWGVL